MTVSELNSCVNEVIEYGLKTGVDSAIELCLRIFGVL